MEGAICLCSTGAVKDISPQSQMMHDHLSAWREEKRFEDMNCLELDFRVKQCEGQILWAWRRWDGNGIQHPKLLSHRDELPLNLKP